MFSLNGYPDTFVSRSTVSRKKNNDNSDSKDERIRVVIPYVEGLSEDVRRVCRDYAVQVVFKSGPT